MCFSEGKWIVQLQLIRLFEAGNFLEEAVPYLGIPTKKTTGSDAWRPSIPIDDDQGAQVRGGTVGCIC
jgi:hypothetical protein